jgi:hypothetical protein
MRECDDVMVADWMWRFDCVFEGTKWFRVSIEGTNKSALFSELHLPATYVLPYLPKRRESLGFVCGIINLCIGSCNSPSRCINNLIQ